MNNTVLLIGQIVPKTVFKNKGDGWSNYNFKLRTIDSTEGEDGAVRELKSYIPCIIWNPKVSLVGGEEVKVEGRIVTRSVPLNREDPQSKTYTAVSVSVSRINIITAPPKTATPNDGLEYVSGDEEKTMEEMVKDMV